MIGRPALGAVWPVLNKHLCCQQPIYVTVHATEEGRRQYYSVLQLPRGNYQHAFLSTAIVIARPNCPMQTHHLAITHGSSRIVQKIMQYMLKLSRVQGIFYLCSMHGAALKSLQICIHMVSAYIEQCSERECSIYVSVYSFPKLTSRLAKGWGQRQPSPPPS